jgi:hypothetical protein
MDYEQVWFDDGTPDGTPPPADTPPATPPTPDTPPTEKKFTKTEVLRELSQELGVNVFEAEGLKRVKELIDSQKTEQQKLQEQLDAYKTKEAEWQSTQAKYQAQLKASELGIRTDALEDALVLAGNDPDKLPDVVKKYPIFLQKDGVQIGFQDPNNTTPPSGKDAEVEAYMAQNYQSKKYQKYLKK